MVEEKGERGKGGGEGRIEKSTHTLIYVNHCPVTVVLDVWL